MIFIYITILNVLILFLINSSKKYWLIPIFIWTTLILTFIVWRTNVDAQYQKLENSYWKKTSNVEFSKLNDAKDSIIKNNMFLLQLIGFQTFITFIIQNIGFYKTEDKKTYRWTCIFFACMTLIFAVIGLLIGIVPTSGILG